MYVMLHVGKDGSVGHVCVNVGGHVVSSLIHFAQRYVVQDPNTVKIPSKLTICNYRQKLQVLSSIDPLCEEEES